ncbi:MAG: DUF3857 domain-containing protein, partial [Bacteroidota bacterium]
MEKGFCLICFAFLSLHGLMAQKAPVIWGKITPEERNFTADQLTYPASAIMLCDYGVWRLTGNEERMALDRHVRIKILDSTALHYAKAHIPFRKEDGLQEIKRLEAQTITYIDGKRSIKKLALKYLPDTPLPHGMAEKVFVFRDVEPGSIIEYRYTLFTQDAFSLPLWYFMLKIPEG